MPEIGDLVVTEENGRRLFIAQGDADWQVTTADGIEAWKAALEGRSSRWNTISMKTSTTC